MEKASVPFLGEEGCGLVSFQESSYLLPGCLRLPSGILVVPLLGSCHPFWEFWCLLQDPLKPFPGSLWLTSGILNLTYWELPFTSCSHFLEALPTLPTPTNTTSTPISRTQSPYRSLSSLALNEVLPVPEPHGLINILGSPHPNPEGPPFP